MDAVLHQDWSHQVLSLLHQNHFPQDCHKRQRTRLENQHSGPRNLSRKLNNFFFFFSRLRHLLAVCITHSVNPWAMKLFTKNHCPFMGKTAPSFCCVSWGKITVSYRSTFAAFALFVYLHKGVLCEPSLKPEAFVSCLPVANIKVCCLKAADNGEERLLSFKWYSVKCLSLSHVRFEGMSQARASTAYHFRRIHAFIRFPEFSYQHST